MICFCENISGIRRFDPLLLLLFLKRGVRAGEHEDLAADATPDGLPTGIGIGNAVVAEPASISESRGAAEFDVEQDPDGSGFMLLPSDFDYVDVDHKNFYVVPEPAVLQAILGEKAMIAGVRTGPRNLAGADTVAPDEPHGEAAVEAEHIREDEVADNSEVLFIRSPVLVFVPSAQAQAVFDALKALKVTV